MPKPIVVLGASGGIGRAIALRLAKDGWPLILGGRDPDRLAEVASATGCRDLLICDCTDEAAVAQAFAAAGEDHGALAGLVFSVAQPFKYRLAHRTPWPVFAEQMESQLKALHTVAVAALPLLAANEGTSRFVVLGSEVTLGAPPLKTAPYAAAKTAMTAYAQVIAQEWLKQGVRVHILAPGLVRTELVADMPDAFLDQLAETMPEKRLTAAEDVAATVAFCMTDAADPLYGTPIRVSRGERW